MNLVSEAITFINFCRHANVIVTLMRRTLLWQYVISVTPYLFVKMAVNMLNMYFLVAFNWFW